MIFGIAVIAFLLMWFMRGKTEEAEDGTLSVRRLGSEKSETMKVEEVIALMQREAVPPDCAH